MYVDAKVGILTKFGSQVLGARTMKIRESRLSYIIHGHVKPTAAELAVLRRELGDDVVNRSFGREPEEAQPAA